MRHVQLPRLDGSRVLVVEGHGDTLELNATVLALHGAEVRSAESGEAALEVLDSWWPNALLTDLGLPGMSGFELAERASTCLHSHPLQPLPVVGTCADARPRVREYAIERGFSDCLAKPYDTEALCDAIARALGRRGKQRPS
jgi:CheY-like chemotaxis protein